MPEHLGRLWRGTVARQELDGCSRQMVPRLAEPGEHVRQPAHRCRSRSCIACRAEARDSLFVDGSRLPVAIAQQERLAPAGQDRQPLASVRSGDVQGVGEVALGDGDIEAERLLPGSRESADRRSEQ